ncbi:MAG: alpha/beta hydrolase [Chloroflexota bacterium]
MSEFTSKFVEAGGHRLHYLDEGSGPPLVLLHGGGPAAYGGIHYTRNIAPWAAHFRVLAPDFPNFGKSSHATFSQAQSRFNAATIDAFMGAIGIGSAAVAGYSMGGSAAISLAAHHPQRVSKLVLLGAGGTSLPSLFVPAPADGARTMMAFTQNPTRENFGLACGAFVFDTACYEPGLVDRLWTEYQQTPPAPTNTSRPRDNLVPALALIQAETLIMKGRDDRLAPLAQGLAALWAIPKASLHVFAKCGHWMQYEKADELNRLVASFLTA